MKTCLTALASLLAGVAIGYYLAQQPVRIEEKERLLVRIDTVERLMPAAKETRLLGYAKVKTERRKPSPRLAPDTCPEEAEVPITQAVYADTLYRAWVSGYSPRLDSIKIFAPSYVYRPKPKRWHIGPYAGLGIGPSGRLQPSIGISVTYSLYSF